MVSSSQKKAAKCLLSKSFTRNRVITLSPARSWATLFKHLGYWSHPQRASSLVYLCAAGFMKGLSRQIEIKERCSINWQSCSQVHSGHGRSSHFSCGYLLCQPEIILPLLKKQIPSYQQSKKHCTTPAESRVS